MEVREKLPSGVFILKKKETEAKSAVGGTSVQGCFKLLFFIGSNHSTEGTSAAGHVESMICKCRSDRFICNKN